jgi:hypothetical protein
LIYAKVEVSFAIMYGQRGIGSLEPSDPKSRAQISPSLLMNRYAMDTIGSKIHGQKPLPCFELLHPLDPKPTVQIKYPKRYTPI